MNKPVQLAVLGAGHIGKRHIEHIVAEPEAVLYAVVDPLPGARDIASASGTRWYPDFAAMIASGRPDGVIIATPNKMHVDHGLQAIAADIPALIEKPIADDAVAGFRLTEAAHKAGVPLQIGHHRRHNPMIQRAKALIDAGRLGRIVSVHGFFWVMKPDRYFAQPWRREPGAGPVLLNLIHDVDLMRYLCGEVEAVQAVQSSAVRQYPVEDTAAIILKFANGALGTMNVTDTAVSPWSWEHTTGESPDYPHTDQACYYIGGTLGSLSVPRLELWTNAATRSWWEPFAVERSVEVGQDPLRLQIRQFCKVVRGEEKPLVSGEDGLCALKIVDAIKRAAHTGELVKVEDSAGAGRIASRAG